MEPEKLMHVEIADVEHDRHLTGNMTKPSLPSLLKASNLNSCISFSSTSSSPKDEDTLTDIIEHAFAHRLQSRGRYCERLLPLYETLDKISITKTETLSRSNKYTRNTDEMKVERSRHKKSLTLIGYKDNRYFARVIAGLCTLSVVSSILNYYYVLIMPIHQQLSLYSQEKNDIMRGSSPRSQGDEATLTTVDIETSEFHNNTPHGLSGYMNRWELNEATDFPVFWHVLHGGGSTITDIIGFCYHMNIAREAGIAVHGDETTKKTDVQTSASLSPHVALDRTWQQAKTIGMAKKDSFDLIVTLSIFQANDLFDKQYQGRLFAIFRHPIDRAVTRFQYLQHAAEWDHTISPRLRTMSMDDYAVSEYVENNWLTRSLTNKMEGDLSDKDLQLAKDITRQKIIVGLSSKIVETMDVFDFFFRLKCHKSQEKCRARLLSGFNDSHDALMKDQLGTRTIIFSLLAKQNVYDLKLYEYIQGLFLEQQSSLFAEQQSF